MGKIDCFSLDGLEVWLHSHDHRPPHFHARKAGGWEVRVYFLESEWDALFDVARSTAGVVPKSALKPLAKMAATHRAALLLEWETKLCSE